VGRGGDGEGEEGEREEEGFHGGRGGAETIGLSDNQTIRVLGVCLGAGGIGRGRKGGGTSNIQHPTLNIQWPPADIPKAVQPLGGLGALSLSKRQHRTPKRKRACSCFFEFVNRT
jgi:hypothetical protein